MLVGDEISIFFCGQPYLIRRWIIIPVDITHYHTPLRRFSVLDISTVGIVPVCQEGRVLETCRRELSEDRSFGIGTLLVAEQSTLENGPRGV